MNNDVQPKRNDEFNKRRRGQILEQARELARSGLYSDCTNIIAVLEPVEGFENARRRFEEDAIRSQINRLCAMAQASMARAS
jgi:hypothetical protein